MASAVNATTASVIHWTAVNTKAISNRQIDCGSSVEASGRMSAKKRRINAIPK